MMIGAQLGPFRRSCPRGHMQAIPGLDLLPDLSHFGQQLWVFVAHEQLRTALGILKQVKMLSPDGPGVRAVKDCNEAHRQ